MAIPDLFWLETTFPELTGFRELGVGGQKVVIAAVHATDGKVVLKLVRPGTDEETVRRELLAVQRIGSARVPRIMDHGVALTQMGRAVWVREEFIEGETVRRMLARGPLSPCTLLRLGLHVMEALGQAETARIVHRDVKPDNIICDTRGNFWLLDFGIARHLDLLSQTATDVLFGKMTLGYAPPEQCRNMKLEIDSRADLFALGVTLHECALGRNPFANPPPRDGVEMLRRVEMVQPVPLNLPIARTASFRDLVHSMTQKNRIYRPRTVSEALAWLREIASFEGVA